MRLAIAWRGFTRPQLGEAAWLACGWQRLDLREKKTRQERLAGSESLTRLAPVLT